MKLIYIFSAVFVYFIFSTETLWSQTTIAQWNFNGTSATTILGGETSPLPSSGSGSAELVGGTTATFASGLSSGGSSDPVATSPPNYGWNTTNYAALGTENKERGVQFNVSTTGFGGITFRFDQRLSNTANNTYVVQYTADRTATTPIWVDAQTFTFTPDSGGTTGDVWYNLRTVDFSLLTILNNNPNVAFRVVSAFDPVAGNYLAATSNSTYSTSGTVRFDMVTVSAAVLSIDEFVNVQNKFLFYPNPVKDNMIYFNGFSSVSIYDNLGKNVLNATDVKQLGVSNLNSGLYFIKNSEGKVSKMIKN